MRLVDSSRPRNVKEGIEKRASLLAEDGVDALNMHHTDWSPGFTTIVLLAAGVDGIYGNDVEEMVAAVTAWTR